MADPKVYVDVTSGWNHMMNAMGKTAARRLKKSQQTRAAIRQLIRKGR